MSEMDGQVSMFDQDGWYGKTCAAPSQAESRKETISESSWKSWRGLSKKESQFLDLRRASGRPLESSSATGTQSHGESWMPNTTESHRDEDGLSSLLTSADTLHLALFLETANTSEAPLEPIPSKLSDILEVGADKKYHLSATACEGILRRAERRGKELPPMLKEALEQMIQRGGAVAVGVDGYNAACTGDKSATLGVNCGVSTGRNGVIERRAGGLDAVSFNWQAAAGVGLCVETKRVNPLGCTRVPAVSYLASGKETVGTLMANAGTKLWLGNQEAFSGDYSIVEEHPTCHIVRRLTPTECERLNGYPDGWTDIGDWVDSKGKKHKAADSPRYKALGNSIALPVWKIILKRLCACYERDATMASLFDGIGGFPYLWEQINGEGSCLWASEIEEFLMAVTRKRINKEH